MDTPSIIFTTRGNIELLSQNKIALFASRKTPETMLPDIFDFFDQLRELPIGLSGGWHSPAEKRLFKRMDVAQTANVLHYFARELNSIKPTAFQEQLLTKKKLLMIAPETKSKRANKTLVRQRDLLLLSQNKKVCFLHISRGGRLENYFNQLLEMKHSVFILEHPLNEAFYCNDAVTLNTQNLDLLFVA
jgi:hypothetical protein